MVETPEAGADQALKARHRALWAMADYGAMVELMLLPLGTRLVEACAIGPGMRVLDVAAGTGNAALRAAAVGADVVASDLTPSLLEVGRTRAAAQGLSLQCAADEMVRVCRPGGTIGLLNWTPEGMIGALFRTLAPWAPPPPPGVQPPPLWGTEEHLGELFGGRVDFTGHRRESMVVTAFERARDYGEYFKVCFGPTIVARGNAESQDSVEEFDAALDAFCEEWNRGQDGSARFEKEYLLSVGERR